MAKTHRDFLNISDFSRAELNSLFALAERMRAGQYDRKPLAGKSRAMIFMKSSTRTRVSVEAGTWQLGGHAMFLSSRDIQLGRGEEVSADVREGPQSRVWDEAENRLHIQKAIMAVLMGGESPA
jgi:ornithine carbamoyltransferase